MNFVFEVVRTAYLSAKLSHAIRMENRKLLHRTLTTMRSGPPVGWLFLSASGQVLATPPCQSTERCFKRTQGCSGLCGSHGEEGN